MARYILVWVPMLFIAIANGALRDFTYGKHMSELRAHQFSTLTALLLLGGYIFALTGLLEIRSLGQATSIGLIWLGLTAGFEFGFGRYAMGNSWKKLLHDYDVSAGRVWVLVLIWVATAPSLFYAVRH